MKLDENAAAFGLFHLAFANLTQQLAIAVPEQGDKIVVTHFALDGATAALQRLREALNEQSSSAEHDRKADKERPSRLPARRGEPSSSA